jgi:hypothetical protein
LRVAKTIPNAPAPESDNQPIAIALNPPYPPVGAVAAALNVKLDFAVLDPGVMVAGEREHVMPEGCVQNSEIGLLNPPTALALTVSMVDWPGVTVALCAERASEKSALVTVAAGTSVANKPLVCELPPAVK